MKTVRVIVSFKLKDRDLDYATTYLSEFAKSSRSDPGCLSYEFLRDQEDKNQFCFVELWESEEAVLAHTSSAYFKEFAPFFATHFEQLNVKQMSSIPF